MYKSKLKKCEQCRKDCINYFVGLCKCLNDTHFDGPCIFYKNIAQWLEEQQRLEESEYKYYGDKNGNL